jgi:hypothetical protein
MVTTSYILGLDVALTEAEPSALCVARREGNVLEIIDSVAVRTPTYRQALDPVAGYRATTDGGWPVYVNFEQPLTAATLAHLNQAAYTSGRPLAVGDQVHFALLLNQGELLGIISYHPDEIGSRYAYYLGVEQVVWAENAHVSCVLELVEK